MVAWVPVIVTLAVPLPTTVPGPAAVSVPFATVRTTCTRLPWTSATEIVLPPLNGKSVSSVAVTLAGAVFTGAVFATRLAANSEVSPVARATAVALTNSPPRTACAGARVVLKTMMPFAVASASFMPPSVTASAPR